MNTTAPDNALPDGLWQVRITVPSSFLDHCDLLLDDAVAISHIRQNDDNETWILEALMTKEPTVAVLEAGIALLAQVQSIVAPRVEVSFLEARDWLALNQTSLSVFDVGPFRIIPVHHALSIRPDHRRCLMLSAGLAFGSGTHETTQACLLLMASLACRVRPRRLLDLGTGSGILAMAAALLWCRRVVAIDIDPVAVLVARDNAARNALGPRITFYTGAGVDPIRRQRPYDLVFANILSGALVAVAGDIRRVVSQGGWLILSGILVLQENQILCRYRAAGFRLRRRLVLGEWVSFLLQRA